MLNKKQLLLSLFLFGSFFLLRAQPPTSTNGLNTVFMGKSIFVPESNILQVLEVEKKRLPKIRMGLTNQKKDLKIKVSLPNSDVKDGTLAFGIVADTEEELKIDIYDEEGFAFQTDKKINLKQGNNYFMLDVSFLEEGKYYIELLNAMGESSIFSINVRKTEAFVDELTIFSVDFMGQEIQLLPTDIQKVQRKGNETQDDELFHHFMRSIFRESGSNLDLPIIFNAVDKPIENGLFVFSIQTETEMELDILVFDEDAFLLTVDGRIELKKGMNYKALEFKTIKDGKYYLQLKGKDNKDFAWEISIAHKK